MDDDKITIIEGPPPVFESIQDGWAAGLSEAPMVYDTALTHVRTFNGNALLERCYRAWKSRSNIYLEYRDDMGLEKRAPILAARNMETNEGNVLVLWVRRDMDDVEEEDDSDLSDDIDDEIDDSSDDYQDDDGEGDEDLFSR